MSHASWQRLALVALVIGTWSCGDNDNSVGPPTRTVVEFTSPTHQGVDDVRESGNPRVVVGQVGTWLTVWATPAGISAQRSTDDGRHWGAPIVVDDTRQGSAPDLACDRHGVCVTVWGAMSPDFVELDVFASRSSDDGATWSAPVLLSRPEVREGSNGGARIATDGNGTWIVVWDAFDVPQAGSPGSYRIERVASHDGAVTWEAPTPFSIGTAEAFVPRIAADESGRWVTVFSTSNGATDPPEIYQRLMAIGSADGRSWSAPVSVGAGDPQGNRREGVGDVGTDGKGTWHAVWTVQRPDEAAGGYFFEIASARSSDGGATWSVPQQLDVPGASTVDILPRLAADGDGHVVVAWITYLQANSLTILSAQSADGGSTWSVPEAFPGGAGNPQLDGLPFVDLATDGQGAWAAVWALAVPGAPSINELHDVVVARGATVPVAE